MSRVYNFSPGPAMLPTEVLERAQAELADWQGTGSSVMEVSHRGKEFLSVAEQAEADLRELMAIPDNYKVLFLQGGASSQFAMVPLNLLQGKAKADYLLPACGRRRPSPRRSATARSMSCAPPRTVTSVTSRPRTAGDWTRTPPMSTTPPTRPSAGWSSSGAGDRRRAGGGGHVVHHPVAAQSTSPSSALIYAGAQKNIGPAGITVVIVREDLIGKPKDGTPAMFDYQTHAENDSMYNTPPTFAWYMAGLVFDWLKGKGGLKAMAEVNQRKAAKLYAAIDKSGFYANPVEPESRSWMNVPFTLSNADLDATFLGESKKAGLVALKGHRSVGGMRASIYNAMPEAGVDALIDFMAEFERKHG